MLQGFKKVEGLCVSDNTMNVLFYVDIKNADIIRLTRISTHLQVYSQILTN